MISRFHEKRKRRVWKKKIRYHCRKNLADSRVRVKGRFVKSADDIARIEAAAAAAAGKGELRSDRGREGEREAVCCGVTEGNARRIIVSLLTCPPIAPHDTTSHHITGTGLVSAASSAGDLMTSTAGKQGGAQRETSLPCLASHRFLLQTLPPLCG